MYFYTNVVGTLAAAARFIVSARGAVAPCSCRSRMAIARATSPPADRIRRRAHLDVMGGASQQSLQELAWRRASGAQVGLAFGAVAGEADGFGGRPAALRTARAAPSLPHSTRRRTLEDAWSPSLRGVSGCGGAVSAAPPTGGSPVLVVRWTRLGSGYGADRDPLRLPQSLGRSFRLGAAERCAGRARRPVPVAPLRSGSPWRTVVRGCSAGRGRPAGRSTPGNATPRRAIGRDSEGRTARCALASTYRCPDLQRSHCRHLGPAADGPDSPVAVHVGGRARAEGLWENEAFPAAANAHERQRALPPQGCRAPDSVPQTACHRRLGLPPSGAGLTSPVPCRALPWVVALVARDEPSHH